MKRLEDYKIGVLTVFFNAAIIIILISLGFYVYSLQRGKVMGDTDTVIFEQVNDFHLSWTKKVNS